MTELEKLVLGHFSLWQVRPWDGSLQFANQHWSGGHRNLATTLCSLSPAVNVFFLFASSSAFNNIQPVLLRDKLERTGVDQQLAYPGPPHEPAVLWNSLRLRIYTVICSTGTGEGQDSPLSWPASSLHSTLLHFTLGLFTDEKDTDYSDLMQRFCGLVSVEPTPDQNRYNHDVVVNF